MIQFSVIDTLIGHTFRARRLDGGPWQCYFAQERMEYNPSLLLCRLYDEFGQFTDIVPVVCEEELENFEIVVLD